MLFGAATHNLARLTAGVPILTGFLAPNASQLIDLGPLVSGQHWFLISATGRSGGGNSGSLIR